MLSSLVTTDVTIPSSKGLFGAAATVYWHYCKS